MWRAISVKLSNYKDTWLIRNSIECNPQKWRSVLECGSLINNTGSWSPWKAPGYGLPGPFYPIFEIKEVFCDDCHMSNTDIAGKRGGGIEANFAKIYRITAQIHPWCIKQWFSNFFAGSPMESIPAELLFQIFRLITLKSCQKLSEKNKIYITRLLPNQDLMVAVQVCKQWRYVSIC